MKGILEALRHNNKLDMLLALILVLVSVAMSTIILPVKMSQLKSGPSKPKRCFVFLREPTLATTSTPETTEKETDAQVRKQSVHLKVRTTRADLSPHGLDMHTSGRTSGYPQQKSTPTRSQEPQRRHYSVLRPFPGNSRPPW